MPLMQCICGNNWIMPFRQTYHAPSSLDCIECGACTYVCPARRPIVQWIKLCKGELARAKATESKS